MSTPSSERPAGLVRALGPFTAMAIVIGTVIGSGIFRKPQVVAENVPYFGLAASVWVLGGLLALLGALALAEVAVLFPRAGGNYVFLREGYGRLAGFLWGWVEFWIIRGASLAALATFFTESLHDILRYRAASGGDVLDFWTQRWLTVLVIFILALVNARGVQWGGFLQLFITLVKIGSLLGIMVLPFLPISWLPIPETSTPGPHWSYLSPWWPDDAGAINLDFFGKYGTALVGVLFAYHGWMNIVPVAEEVKEPQRNLPLALLGGTLTVTFLYLGANFAYYLTLPRMDIALMKDPSPPVATAFGQHLLGPIGAAVAAAVAMCSVFGALNGNLLVGPRLLYAMGEDGLAPRRLGAVHPRYRTPALAILIMAGWAAALVILASLLTRYRIPPLPLGSHTIDLNVPEGKPIFDLLTDFAIFGSVTFETLAVASIFVFRWRLPLAERPYRCLGYPVVPALYIGIMGLVLVNMFSRQLTESLTGVGFIALGAVVYALTVGRRAVVPQAEP